jgi:hypothetical protein
MPKAKLVLPTITAESSRIALDVKRSAAESIKAFQRDQPAFYAVIDDYFANPKQTLTAMAMLYTALSAEVEARNSQK